MAAAAAVLMRRLNLVSLYYEPESERHKINQKPGLCIYSLPDVTGNGET